MLRGEIMKFLLWCVENKRNWLTADGTDRNAHIKEEHGGEGVCAQRSHTHIDLFGFFVHVMNYLFIVG